MVPPFSPEQAAELYACMLADVLDTTAKVCRRLDLDAIVALHPASAMHELAERCPSCFRVVAQRGRDLAKRMERAVLEAAAAASLPVLLRGSDSPLLAERTHEEAFACLATHDLVASPDRDGGYSLIGLNQPCAGLFDHAMSTRSVLEDTLANARAASLRTKLLEPGSDFDHAADLLTLQRARERRADAERCRRTLAFLDRTDAWSWLESKDASLD